MYHHIHQEVVCSQCGSSRREYVTRYMVGWWRCIGCGHEGEKFDQRTGQPFVPYEERVENERRWNEMMNRPRPETVTF